MAAAQCYPLIRGKKVRVTALDECGVPPTSGTPDSQVVTEGFVSVDIEPEIEGGDDYTQKNANGELCVVERGCDFFKRWSLTVTLCKVLPEMVTLMTGNPVETDASGQVVGFRHIQSAPCVDFALELWTGTGEQSCGIANEVQSVTVPDTVDTYTLTFNGNTTADIDDQATAAEVQAALVAIPGINPGDVTVGGNPGGPYYVEFTGQYSQTDVTLMTAATTGGTGTVTVVETVKGGSATGKTYGYLLLPFVRNGIAQGFQIENGSTTFEVQAWTQGNSGWGSGPYNVVLDGTGNPAPLDDPILGNEHSLLRLTQVPPPDAFCGSLPMP